MAIAPPDRGDVDDPPGLPPAQVGEGGQGGVERTPEVDPHRRLEVLHPHVLQRADLDDAGVVDQDVETAEALGRRVDRPADLVLVADVAGQGEDAQAADRRQLAAGEVELGRVAGEDGDPRPLGRQLAGHQEPQAARAAGDHRHPVVELDGGAPPERPRQCQGGTGEGGPGEQGGGRSRQPPQVFSLHQCVCPLPFP